MTQTISREWLEEIDAVLKAGAVGISVDADEIRDMARMLLAGMSSEPVAYLYPGDEKEWQSVALPEELDDEQKSLCVPLYAAPPAPVSPDGLRLALSNAGIAAPESDEVLFATHEKYVQLLVDWVKDRKPFSPTPVAVRIPPEKPHTDGLLADGWNACRAAMQAELVSSAYKLPDGWIKCSERMPDEGDDMIVFADGIVMSGISYDKKKGFYIQALEYDDDEPIDNVTHWMPLPAAPEQEV